MHNNFLHIEISFGTTCFAVESTGPYSRCGFSSPDNAYSVSVKCRYCRHMHEYLKYIGATLNNLKILEMPLGPQEDCQRERGLYFQVSW